MLTHVHEFLHYLTDEQESSSNTTAAYRNDLTQFTKYVEDCCSEGSAAQRNWNAVDAGMVRGYVGRLKEAEYASATVARKVAAIRSFFHWMEGQGRLGCNPADGLEAPRVKKLTPRPIRPQEVERLLAEPARARNAPAVRDRALLETLYASGMRVSEVVNLNLQNVDLARGSICVGRDDAVPGGRVVTLQPSALNALRRYLETGRSQLLVQPDEQALFLNHRGQRLTRQGLWLVIKRYVKQAGISATVTPHTLRQSFAAHQINAGVGLQQVQEIMGHASMQTTQAYRRAAGSIADELSGATRLDDGNTDF